MESVETQIAEWRAHVAKAPAVNGRDVAELEDHLRDQIDELRSAGVSLMPVGLEKDLTPQQVADVIAFIKSIATTAK